jgi:hypothetical protein
MSVAEGFPMTVRRLLLACLMLTGLAVSLASAWAYERSLTYGPAPIFERFFGASLLHDPEWDRYLMYFTANGSIVSGRPSNKVPGDPGTYNDTCATWWGDRIWLTWHFGDGINPQGWDAADGVGNVPPLLMLTVGGPGESAMIGDPAVVYWAGQWHMYYDGTDDCAGNSNQIFHATGARLDWTVDEDGRDHRSGREH